MKPEDTGTASPYAPTESTYKQGTYGSYQPNSYDLGVDNTAMAAGSGGSVWEDVSNLATKGVPLMAKSIVLSFMNMPADVGNWFGGENHITKMDEFLGEGNEEQQQYYKEHSTGIDVGGLIVGSFIPGLGVTKVFGAAKVVKGIRAGAIAAEDISFATGLLPSVKSASVLAEATAKIKSNYTVYSSLTADTFKAAAWGIADQAITMAAWETATIATMHSNPVLNSDGLGDSLSHIFWGGVVGGVFAAPFSIMGARGSLQTVKGQMERLDIGQRILEKAGVGATIAGDTTAQTIASVFSMEKLDPALTASAKAQAESRSAAVRLDAVQQFNKVSQDSNVSNAMIDMIYSMKEKGVPLVGENGELGILNYLMGAKAFHRVDNPKFLTTDPGEMFLNIHAPGSARGVFHPEGQNFMTSTYDPTAVHSLRVKFASPEAQRDFRYAVEGDHLKIGSDGALADSLAPTAEKAWEYGFDAWVNKQNRLHINPKAVRSDGTGTFLALPKDVQIDADVFKYLAKEGTLPATYKKTVKEYNPVTGETVDTVIDAHFQQIDHAAVVVNTRSGAVMKDFATPTVGDLSSYAVDKLTGKIKASSDVKLVNDSNTLEFGSRSRDYGITKQYDPTNISNIDANGHFVWAHLRGLKKGDVIAADNLPMLEAAVYSLKGKSAKEVAEMRLSIQTADGRYTEFPESLDVLQQRVIELKQDLLAKLTAPEEVARAADDLATRVNAPLEWVESGGQLADFTKMSINPAEHLELKHVRVDYDLSPVKFDANSNIAKGVQAMQYRIDMAAERTKLAATAFFGENSKFIVGEYGVNFNSGMADTASTSANFIKKADSDYNTLSSQLLAQGQALTQVIQKAKQSAEEFVRAPELALSADAVAGAEFAALRNAHLRMSEKFAPLDVADPMLKQQVETMLGRELKEGEAILVPKKSMGTDDMGNLTWDHTYRPSEIDNPRDALKWVTADKVSKLPNGASDFETPVALGMYVVNPKAAAFLRAQQELNDARLIHQYNYQSAIGDPRAASTKALIGTTYFPPMNAKNYTHMAFVRQTGGLGGGTGSVSMVLGKDANDLAERTALLKANHPELEIIPYGQGKEYLKARGDYEYNLNMTSNDVNSMMARKGVLVDYVPDMRIDTTLDDYAAWNAAMITRQHRNFAELGNGQLYAELDMMGKQWEWIAKSKKGVVNESQSAMSADNPYQALKYQGLGINPRVHYTLWNDGQDKVEALFTTAFNKAREAFSNVHKGLIPVEEAEKITRSYGLGNPFGATVTALENYRLASGISRSPIMEKFVRTANAVQTATAIRLDAMQGFINTISTPILMWPEALSAAKKLGVTTLPDGSGVNFFSLRKLDFQAVRNWNSLTPEAMQFKKDLHTQGILKTDVSTYFELVDDMTLRGGESFKVLEAKMEGMVDKGSKLLGTKLSEQFGRFWAADVARQIFSSAGQTGPELMANINTFVSRVHGATIAAQRPIAFQGPIGAAIGLFQTYQFNFLQNVFRYVGQGDYKALALLTGLQSTLYGMQGLPGFNFVNQYIVGDARNNPAHTDIYSATKSALGNHLGDYVLYGSASNILQSGLYTRGDVNPRQVTILPVNPLDIPTVASSIRAMSNIATAAQKLQDGGAFWNTFTEGLEHNGMSRPMAGLGQILQGYSTTSKGSLISANRPAEIAGPLDLLSISNASRLLGARPLDEAVIMDAMYRHTMYQAVDTARMTSLGKAVKETLRKGQSPSEEQMATFISKYTAAGGHPNNFGKHMVEWVKSANTSVANETYNKLRTPAIQNQQVVMGGVRLPDYSMNPVGGTQAAATGVAPIDPTEAQP